MKFGDVKSKFPKVRIISHTDLDGYGSAAAMSGFLVRTLGYNLEDIDIVHCAPSDDYPLVPGFNIITDLSLNNGNENWKRMVEHSQNPDNLLWWVDHHVTSLEFIEKHPELANIPRIINTDYAATALCWFLHYNVVTYRDFRQSLTEPDVTDIFNEVQKNPFEMVGFPFHSFHRRIYPTIAVKLTDDWDLFKRNLNGSICFNSAFYTCPAFNHDAKSIYFQEAFGRVYDMAAIYDSATVDMFNLVTSATNYLLEFGTVSLNWQKSFYLTSLLSTGFVARIEPTVKTADNYNIRNLRFICHNRTDSNMVTAAPLLLEKYHWGINFNIKERGFYHTVYCTNPGDVSAKDVATAMGGGGHPGCAGFRSDSFVFKDISPLDDDMKALIKQDLKAVKRRISPVPDKKVKDILCRRMGEE